MFGVDRLAIWIAFGLSVVFHVAGLELAVTLPRLPHSSPPPLVKLSIRSIQPPQQFVKNSSKSSNQIPKPDETPAQTSFLPLSMTDQKSEAKQTTPKSEAQITEYILLKHIRYFESSEVDNNSELIDEWVVRTQGVQSTAIVAIQLTLYINEMGRLDKFVVLNSSLSEVETDLLLKDLALTVFKPALKDDRPVPSLKNVEILLDPNPPVFRMPSFLNNFLPTNK